MVVAPPDETVAELLGRRDGSCDNNNKHSCGRRSGFTAFCVRLVTCEVRWLSKAQGWCGAGAAAVCRPMAAGHWAKRRRSSIGQTQNGTISYFVRVFRPFCHLCSRQNGYGAAEAVAGA